MIENLKLIAVGDIWDYFCEINGVATDSQMIENIMTYEKNVLFKRQ